jgi:lysyl-tRNA synthetase class 2
MSDFLPTAPWPVLRLRAEMLRRVRGFFDAREFLEVETPILSADVIVDRHLDPLVTEFVPLAGDATVRRTLYLQTSPEFAMKRLLAAGGEAIYQVAHAFRQGEVGRRHNPEFTIIEWYRCHDDLSAGMQLLSDLAEVLLNRGPASLVSYADAFRQAAGVDPHRDSIDALRNALVRRGIVPPASLGAEDRDGWLDLLLVELVEPTLGRPRPTILYDYPPSQAALAQVRASDPPVAERFELYADGMELANGYHELLDAKVLRARNRENNELRARDGKSPLPATSRLLQAMDHGLPPSTGVALGFDRCVMLAAGVDDIRRVLPFPIDRA